MKKGIFITIITLLGMFLPMTSCHEELHMLNNDSVPEGYTQISFTASAPAMSPVAVRAVDPDGVDVQNLMLFCFNEYGLFISMVEAEIDGAETVPSLSGTYKATIPENTYIIHFLANQNPKTLNESHFVNMSEDQVQSEMVGASGMILYWARFIRKPSGTLNEQLKAENNNAGIKLIRNQAKVSIENWETNEFEVTGFVTTNIHAFGTTAPYHPTKRFPTPGTAFEWPGEDFVTLPENLVMMSDIDDVNTKLEDYIYEHENTLSNPVSVIIRGNLPGETKQLYYRVMIVDEQGEQLMIRRNHHYKIQIAGALSYGQETFAEALTAPATNNVWVAVDDWVNEITEGNYTLSVDQTSVVLPDSKAGGSYSFTYTIESTGEPLTSTDNAIVKWEEGNNVAANSISHTFGIGTDGKKGTGTVTIQLLDMNSDDMHSGTLVVKHGRLQRTIQVYMIKTQSFVPSWVSTQIYGGKTGEYVTMKFTIPETCPDVLYPFPVLVSVNSLDVRSSAGEDLPVLLKGEEGYGADNGLGYKYVYTVEGPGPQRIYMHNILTHEEGQTDRITIEADFFETLTKEFAFVAHQNVIDANGMKTYQMVEDENEEKINYYLIPKKINAPFDLEMVLRNKADDSEINAEAQDEFILYSKTLDAVDGNDCNFIEVPGGYEHNTNGRTLPFVLNNPTSPSTTGTYTLNLKTNKALSDDLVRISSNSAGHNSIRTENNGADYTGNTYRSFLFELGTYRPFGFAAQIAINNGSLQGTWNYLEDIYSSHVEPIENISLSYEPSQEVDIYLDVTSFKGSDGKSVDPFGTEFEIYIDAEMLEIDTDRLSACNLDANKLKKDPTNSNRFIYTVDADREDEQNYSFTTAAHGDNKTLKERKKLPFRTRTVTASGEIRISSNKEKVVFYDKVFKLSNTLIKGSIKYYDGTSEINVPKDAFVAFFVQETGVRIGSMAITSDGHFELNLRKEYEFDWDSDAVEMDYIVGNKVYDASFESLKDLFERMEGDETIVLTEAQGD